MGRPPAAPRPAPTPGPEARGGGEGGGFELGPPEPSVQGERDGEAAEPPSRAPAFFSREHMPQRYDDIEERLGDWRERARAASSEPAGGALPLWVLVKRLHPAASVAAASVVAACLAWAMAGLLRGRPLVTGAGGGAAPRGGAATSSSSSQEWGADAPAAQPEQLLGHWRYDLALPGELEQVDGAGSELLHCAAAAAFRNMREAAAQEGVELNCASGYRSFEEQEELYFGVKAERAQSALERARVSAPPGYSEHHTGFAIDICDHRWTLEESFEKSKAFRWLQRNARSFNFDMSFPRGGTVAYEPWHWRFEGCPEAIQTFYGNERST